MQCFPLSMANQRKSNEFKSRKHIGQTSTKRSAVTIWNSIIKIDMGNTMCVCVLFVNVTMCHCYCAGLFVNVPILDFRFRFSHLAEKGQLWLYENNIIKIDILRKTLCVCVAGLFANITMCYCYWAGLFVNVTY